MKDFVKELELKEFNDNNPYQIVNDYLDEIIKSGYNK
jgi:hypothetical protein